MATEKLQGSTGNRAVFTILDADALPWTGLDHTAAGLELWATPEGGTPVAITPSSSNFVEKKNGQYHVLVADSLYEGTARISFSGAITDGTVHGEIHTIRVAPVATEASVQAVAAAVLAAATAAGGIDSNAVAVNGEPMVPLGYEPAKESSVQDVLGAVNGLDGPGAPTGPGGIPVIIPVTSNNQPVDGAAVWITTDPEGTNQIAGVLYTNTFGNTDPAFTLEAGIFYVWVQKAGINFPNPQVIEVLENGTYQWYTG